MGKINFLTLLLLIATLSTVIAGDITLTLDQKEYYFKTGETATIILSSQNTYEKNISGKLFTEITQETSESGIQQSSASTNSMPITIPTNQTELAITFGTSNNPITLNVKLFLEYYEQESRAVNLNDIKIHFIADEEQKQNEQNEQQSSSESQESQQQKQMQEQMEKMQQEGQQQTQEKLANSQNPQDSSALKQQMQQQAQDQAKAKEDFKKQLEQNQQLQEEHQKMLDKGYEMKDMEMNPTENNSGDFKMKYEKENGNEAEISGEMENNELKNLQSITQEEMTDAMNQLEQNEDFQNIQEQLQKENFQAKEPSITKENNQTEIKMEYTNEKNETATITAKIENQAVEEVKLEKENSYSILKILFILFILLIIIFVTYKTYQKYNPKPEEIIPQIKKEKPYNYKKASKQLLAKSKKLFEQKEYKDAYESASQAIRLFLNHKNKLEKETTNDEIIKHLKSKNQNTSKLKNCLDTCSLVEFAKYNPNKKDFNKITTFAESLIK